MNETFLIIFFIAYIIHIIFTIYYSSICKNHEFFYELSLSFLPILGPIILHFTESKSFESGSRRNKFVSRNNFWIFGLQIVLALGVIILFLMFFERGASRIDLTKDKRYSLDKTTKKLLNELSETNQQLIVKYYYSPTELRPRRLQLMPKEIEDLLKEYEEVAPQNFVYKMIEVPQKNLTDEKAKEEEEKEIYKDRLVSAGVESKDETELSADASKDEKAAFEIRKFLEDEKINDIREQTYEGDKKTYQSFYSAFYITYGNKKPFKFDQVFVTETAQKKGASVYAYANVMLTKALRQLIKDPLHIGFLVGHSEKHYEYEQTKILRQILRANEGFEDQSVDLKHGNLPVPDDVAVLIMHATSDVLSEREQFQLDQFIMRGGKILFFSAPLIPPTNMGRYQILPNWSKGDESWANFINKYGVKIDMDEVVFDDECFVIQTQSGEKGLNFLVKLSGDRLTNHPVCAGVTESYMIHNNLIKDNTENLQPDAKFEPIFQSSGKAWSVTLDMDIRQDPMMNKEWTVLNELMENPPQNRNQYVLAAAVSGQFNSAYKQGETPKLVDENGKILDAPAYELKRKTEPVLTKSVDTKIIVYGNSIDYLYFTLQWDNSRIMANMINYLAFGDDYLKIERKTSTFTPLEQVSSDQKTLIRIIVIGAMPLLLIVLGFFLLIYRIQSRYYDQAVFELRKRQKFSAETEQNNEN